MQFLVMPFCSRYMEEAKLTCNETFIDAQAHDQAVRSMVWSYNENWMVTGDDGRSIK